VCTKIVKSLISLHVGDVLNKQNNIAEMKEMQALKNFAISYKRNSS